MTSPTEAHEERKNYIAKRYNQNIMQRDVFSAQFLAAILANANNRGVLPNPEMMAKEAVKYADALLLELSKWLM